MEQSPTEALVFVGILFAMNIGMATLVAWLVSSSRRIIAPSVRYRVLQVAGIALIGAGTFLVWQAMEGNFQSMMEQREGMRDALEELRVEMERR